MSNEDKTPIGMIQLQNGIGDDIKISLETIFDDVRATIVKKLPEPVDVTLKKGGDAEVSLTPHMQSFSEWANQYSKPPETADELFNRFKAAVETSNAGYAGRYITDLDEIRDAVNAELDKRNVPYYLGNAMFIGG